MRVLLQQNLLLKLVHSVSLASLLSHMIDYIFFLKYSPGKLANQYHQKYHETGKRKQQQNSGVITWKKKEESSHGGECCRQARVEKLKNAVAVFQQMIVLDKEEEKKVEEAAPNSSQGHHCVLSFCFLKMTKWSTHYHRIRVTYSRCSTWRLNKYLAWQHLTALRHVSNVSN